VTNDDACNFECELVDAQLRRRSLGGDDTFLTPNGHRVVVAKPDDLVGHGNTRIFS
jgi:hypothetical protein